MTLINETQNYIVQPSLKDLLDTLRNEIFSSLNCSKIGEIVSFDSAKKTAEIKILIKKLINGNYVSYPAFVDVPVFTLQGGGGSIQMPIAAGDQCLVVFSDNNFDTWFSTGNESNPFDNRSHDLSDAIAIVGLNSLRSNLENYPANEVRLNYNNTRLAIKSGKLNLQNTTTSLLQILTDLINGIQGATVSGNPVTDTTGKIATALIGLNSLLYKD